MSSTQTISTPISQFDLLGRSLLTYTQLHPDFARTAASCIPEEICNQAVSPITTPETSPWLLPSDHEAALQRLQWLVSTATNQPASQSELTRAYLTAIKRSSAPQVLVLGIVGVAIIGPTLGLIKSRKKKRNQLRILMSHQTYTTLTPVELAQYASEGSTRLLAQELERVGGNAYQLEPELAEWLFTDQQIAIATFDRPEQVAAAQTLFAHERLPHTTLSLPSRDSVIALSPVVHDDILEHVGALPVACDAPTT